MNIRVVLFACLMASFLVSLQAQGFSGGFKAGLNFARLDGPQEGSGEMTFEQLNSAAGFHVGATFAYEFTDLVGVKGELMYSQKGGEISYEGPGYLYLYTSNGEELFDGVDVVQDLAVVNSYLDIPVTAYYRLGPFEVEAGANASLLVSSRGTGSVRYNTAGRNIGIDELRLTYDANFNGDGPGAQSIVSRAQQTLPNGDPLPSVIGAYYLNDRDDRRFSTLDFGLVFGVAVYLNNGLYVSGRYNHGLSDVTRAENDLRLSEIGQSGERLFNEDDKDYNRVVQVSIGFRF